MMLKLCLLLSCGSHAVRGAPLQLTETASLACAIFGTRFPRRPEVLQLLIDHIYADITLDQAIGQIQGAVRVPMIQRR